MVDQPGLRQRKRLRTHDAISSAAISLFLERGFDQVSVAEIAAAAEVSKPTLFKYFATKEDLVLHRFADHEGEHARVVRQRDAGQTPLAALHRHFLDGLERRDPVTGLNDVPQVLEYHRMVFSTPSLAGRLAGYVAKDEELLAVALRDSAGGDGGDSGGVGGDLTARLAAGQIIAVVRILARDNWRQLVEGRSTAEVYPSAVAGADRAFGMLRSGLY
jgi:AcrR family transcriptional regulator